MFDGQNMVDFGRFCDAAGAATGLAQVHVSLQDSRAQPTPWAPGQAAFVRLGFMPSAARRRLV